MINWIKAHLKLAVMVIVFVAVVGIGLAAIRHRTSSLNTSKLPPCETDTGTNCDRNNITGKHQTACVGKGPATITASPIALTDLAYIQPMGLEIGGHVTPIDHGYFYIKG